MTQQGDVLLFSTTDGGEILVEGGVTQMSGGLETSAYLALFGGNIDDPGTDGSRLQWWGNFTEPDELRHYRSQTQHLLAALPATSGNLKQINEAAANDLAFLVDAGAASAVSVEASIPTRNRVDITVTVTAEGDEQQFTFSANWSAAT